MNWSPKDLRGTKHLLAEHRAIKEVRIARNATAGEFWPVYKAGWTYGRDRDFQIRCMGDKVMPGERLQLNPYRLALDEFEYGPRGHCPYGLHAKDYSDASEGPGRVTVKGSNYDLEETDCFAPRQEFLKAMDATGGWGKHDTLGFDTKSDLVEAMTDAVKAWAGMITPPPKAADPTVEALVQSYLARGGEVHTYDAYRTTPNSEIRFKPNAGSEWAGGTGIPPELRSRKKLFRVKPKTGSKQWSNTV